MTLFRCGNDWCNRASEVCGAFANGRRRCVASLTAPPACDGMGPIAAQCTTERRGVDVTIARELPCGPLGLRCAAGFERCEIAALRTLPPALECVPDTARSLQRCREQFGSCSLVGDDYRVRAEAGDLGTTFYCGGTHTCLRHSEVCVFPAATPNVFHKPGHCEREDFPDCLARGFDRCLDDTFGARYAFR
jgi:hypothetical protein